MTVNIEKHSEKDATITGTTQAGQFQINLNEDGPQTQQTVALFFHSNSSLTFQTVGGEDKDPAVNIFSGEKLMFAGTELELLGTLEAAQAIIQIMKNPDSAQAVRALGFFYRMAQV